MGNNVSWMLELEVQPGRERDFKSLMHEMVEATRANEPGALAYEWSLSADGAVCHIYERYADSAATLVHMGNFGAKYAGRFLEILKPTRLMLYGSPSDEVKKGLAALNAVHMLPVGGFTR